ncbi:TetR/AcrR family transcriptional regulator [Corynebacterium uterequi]|uniref:Transcriptional regulator, TetR family n=1 Tax=Corynebacterium uterequi TaxID=1072256 RepID=A0A0G3HGV2_9CORY|nr:TetR/AcrR family transcriptional regulator [Corynebacterium uterequi]AKK11118.1 transcriptional regulator, TetR family [Corynebacterium uterequi]
MGRPRKNAGTPGAQARMVKAFWNQLAAGPYARISATSIVREVGCNRATFYYYFDSIDDLAAVALAESVPRQIMDTVGQLVSGQATSMELDDATRQAISRLCLIAGTAGSALLIEECEQALQRAWVHRFDLDMARPEIEAVVQFMASGVLGVMGRWAGAPLGEDFDAYLRTITEVFSVPALTFVAGRRSLGGDNPPTRATPSRRHP